MQSFGDNTLLACLNVEKKYRILQEKNEDSGLQEQSGSDLGKYFKESLLLSEFGNEDKVNKSERPTSSKREVARKDESDIGKYFDDSVTFINVNNERKNSLSTLSVSKKDKILSSPKISNFYKTSGKNINTTYLKEKHPLNIIKESNDIEEELQKNEFHDKENAISNSCVATSSAINDTYDKESSGTILSLPLCTQDRCKLASWGLPSNILQVSNYDAIFDRLL